ncbi:MAG TPA: F0F1 ATP synthase subunit B, partial [Polyangiaceae bacterium]|nr:F0F1 ATP synthase subunit B [Polyangiaceae bacterium]
DLKTDAETRLAGYKKQMARIEERRKELHAEYRAQWDAEEKRILNEAAEKSSRMRKDAEFRVGQELKQAQADLLRESVESALAAAEELMKKRIQETDQSRLAEEYLASVVPALTGAKGGRA